MLHPEPRLAPREHEKLLLTDETQRKQTRNFYNVTLHYSVLLQVYKVKTHLPFRLYYERHLPPVMQVLIVAYVDFLYFEPKVVYVRLRNHRSATLCLDLVLEAHQSVAPANYQAVTQNRHNYQFIFFVLELR